MYIKLLDLKSEMKRNGVTLIDLQELNFEVNYFSEDWKIKRIVLVEERHLCRPDLLVWENYRNLDYLDGFLKVNQITNPFSMEIFDVIVIPREESIDAYYKKSITAPSLIKETKALFLDPNRATKKDLARLKQLARLAEKRKNGSSDPKPTNLLRPGEVPFKTDGDRLIFAPSVSSPRFPSSNDLIQ